MNRKNRKDFSECLLTPRSRAIAIAICVMQVVMILLLVAAYQASPQFYLKYVLEAVERESQLVEWLTFIMAALAGLLLLVAAARLWLLGGRAQVRGGAFLIAVSAAAALFFAGEEVSWGQYLFDWEVTDSLGNPARDLNIHNRIDLPMQSLGELYLLGMFVALPGLWRLRTRLKLPKDWAPAIAEWPVVVGMLIAFAWARYDNLFRIVYHDFEQHRFYVEFVEQVGEHKEMLISASLLAFAMYRMSWFGNALKVVNNESPTTHD